MAYHRLPFLSAERERRFLEPIKKEICYHIRRYAMKRGWTQKELAKQIGVSEAKVSQVVRLRLDQLTVDQLFRYLIILKPQVRILISHD